MGESKSKRNARRDDARSRERSSGLFAELEFISLSFHLDALEFAENLEIVGGPHSNLSEGSIVRTAMRSESAYHGDSRRVTKPIAPRFMAREVSNGIQNRYEEIAELWGRREQQRNRGRYAKMIVAQMQAFEKGVIRWVDDAPDATRSQNRRKILFGSGQMRAIDDYGPTDNAGWDKGHGVIVAVKRPDGAWQAIVERRGPSVSRDEDGELIRVDVESVPLYESDSDDISEALFHSFDDLRAQVEYDSEIWVAEKGDDGVTRKRPKVPELPPRKGIIKYLDQKVEKDSTLFYWKRRQD